MEYMIQENTLVEIADALRSKLIYKDFVFSLISSRDKITSINIPNGSTDVRDYAFSGCTSLESVTIPDSVTSMKSNAFYGCTSLTDITIPNSVTSIGINMFTNCNSLTDMYLHPTTPPTLKDTGSISYATTTIHVPIGSGDAYKSATNWSAFADIIVEDIVVE